ncbi:MAG TPA: hypothetical protein VMC79_12835 [Rectinemataceae bacterium]|nr:hypothetical protein [Rectinemataceae bacterium]
MLFIDRSDGRRVKGLPSFNAIMPYLMRTRTESVVYFAKDIDVENALRYVHRMNTVEGSNRYSLFALILSAAVRSLALKPRMNRFVHRRGVYQRKELSISFIVKKKLTEEAAESNAKILFDPRDTIQEATDRINSGIEAARSPKLGADDREVEIAHRIPFGKAVATSAFRFLDHFNVAPASMVRTDPLYTSIYFANLGSIGLDTPYHHLYEWGTASIFVVMGRMFQKDVGRTDGSVARRHFINFKVSLDERIGDGIYFAHAASLFQRLIVHPELLEERPDLSSAEQ